MNVLKQLAKKSMNLLKVLKRKFGVVWRCWKAAWARRNVCAYLYARRYCKIKEKTALWVAFAGRGVLDNPKALFEAMLADPEFKDWTHIWVLDDFKHHKETFKHFKGNKKVRFVTFESCKHFYFFGVAKLVVSNAALQRFFIKREGQIYIETGHGVPLKTLGRLAKDSPLTSVTYSIRSLLQADYLPSACPFLSQVYQNDFYLGNLFKGKILEAGYPRLDTICYSNKDDILARLTNEGVTIDPKKKILLYAPTWRGATYATPDVTIEPYLEVKRTLEKILDLTQWQVLIKPHQIVYKTARKQFKDIDFMVPATIDANEVLSVTDLLVGDFSSIFYDFLLTKRPIVFYIPDLEEYKVARGLYHPIESLPGPICQTLDELSETMAHLDERIAAFADSYEAQREWSGSHLDQGDNSRRIIRHILLGEPAPMVAPELKRLSYLFLLPPNLTKLELYRLIDELNAFDSEKVDVTLLTEGDKRGTLEFLKKSLAFHLRVMVRVGVYRTFMDELRWHRYSKRGAQAQASLPKAYFEEEIARYLGKNAFDFVVDVSGTSLFYTTMATLIPAKKRLIWAMGDLPSEARSIRKGLSKVFPLYSQFDAVVTQTTRLQMLNQKGLPQGIKVDLLEHHFDNALLVKMPENTTEDAPFDFSIIMAVYNVEPYLREAIESVLKQDIGFENHVQLILVDDGSPDGSGKICDEYAKQYPNNIVVIHKENGGVSSARNAGIEVATGRYLNFLDADDKHSLDTLSKVKYFFDQNHDRIGVVAIPIYFFGAMKGAHPNNGRFNKGTRVINLFEEPTAIQNMCNAAFFTPEQIGDIRFDTNLIYGEDALFCQQVLLKNPQIGLLANCKYLYRKRSGEGMESAVQSRSWKVQNYRTPRYFFLPLIEQSKKIYGDVPRFIRCILSYYLQWELKSLSKIPCDIGLSTVEIEQCKQEYLAAIREADDAFIASSTRISLDHRLAYFKHKYASIPKLKCLGQEAVIAIDETQYLFSYAFMQWHSLREEKGKIFICVAFVQFAGLPAPEKIFAACGGKCFEATLLASKDGTCFMEESLYTRHLYEIEVPLHELPETAKLNFYFTQGGETYHAKQISRHTHFPVSNQFNASYCILQNRCIMAQDCELILARKYRHWKKELKLLLEIFKKRKGRWKEDLLIRVLRFVRQKLHCKPIWLLKDRATNADDNAEAMFRYLVKEHPEVKAYFVIDTHSHDGQRLKNVGKLVHIGSRRGRILDGLASVYLSSHGRNEIIPSETQRHALRDILALRTFIFLQHGVTQNDLSGWLWRYNQNIMGLVTAARMESQSILNGAYAYSEKSVWLTGFPRFDGFMDNGEKQKKRLTFMPTWRRWLFNRMNAVTNIFDAKPNFEASNYFKFYNALLTDSRLLEAARTYGYKIAFFPHPIVRLSGLSDKFDCKAVELIDSSTSYREVYAESDLILTDYSSAVFDFAYLRKPIVYTHFDGDEFFSGKHTVTKGYFDYDRDGFGEVTYTLEATVDCLIDYMKNNCQLKPMYRERIEKFFAYDDQKNCECVYDKVCEVLAPKA